MDLCTKLRLLSSALTNIGAIKQRPKKGTRRDCRYVICLSETIPHLARKSMFKLSGSAHDIYLACHVVIFMYNLSVSNKLGTFQPSSTKKNEKKNVVKVGLPLPKLSGSAHGMLSYCIFQKAFEFIFYTDMTSFNTLQFI